MRTFFGKHRIWMLPVAVLITAIALVATVFVALGATGRLPTTAAKNAAAATGTDPAPALPTAVRQPSGVAGPAGSPASPPAIGVGSAAAAALPRTGDPRVFAVAFARALFSYDTESESETAWTASLAAGLDAGADVHPDNLADLADRTPPPAVWSTMTASGQRASFTLTRVWVPQLWTANASAYPPGAAAVTIDGTQHVVWAGGSSDVPASVTLLLVCPPLNSSCVVNRIAAQVLR